MSSSTVTYTYVYTNSEPKRVFWGADEELSDEGSLRVIIYGYDGLPMQPVAPPSLDYVPGPEHPPSSDYVPGPEHPPLPVEVPYVPDPEYPEYLVPSDAEAPLEDQPLPDDASPTALSPGYVADSDMDEDPEEDPEEDHTDYLADGGDGDDEPSDDYNDDDDTDDEDASPQTKVPFAQTRLRRARKTISLEPPMSASIEARIAEHAAAPTPPLPISSPPLPLPSPLTTSPTDAGTDIPQARDAHRKSACFTTLALCSEDMSAAIKAHVRTLEAQKMTPRKRTTKASPATTTTATTPTSTPITNAQLRELIERGIATVLAERDADRSRKGDDSHDSGTGGRRQVSTIRECTYTDFLKCQPMNFKGTKGVVGLTQWLEKMESVFHINNCTVACQVKFATCTLQGNALTWWNSHVWDVGHDIAYEMPWNTLKKMMTDKYCLRSEIKKLETEIMFPEESNVVEKYFGGLPDMIHGSVKASKPMTMQEAIEFSIELMDKKILTITERQAENKRKFKDTSQNNQNQQQPLKRNNVARAFTARLGEKKPCGGSKPLCPKCNYHHDGPCAPKCTNCKRIGHLAHDCKSRHATANNNQRAQRAHQRVLTCFECGAQGHFRSDCPKLKNRNQARNGNAIASAYAIGTARTNPNSNVVKGRFLLNNRYALILFDTGVDRIFVFY
ncbi:putative reverse transcriptase domain-containing protein [Tanacetum coccineum]